MRGAMITSRASITVRLLRRRAVRRPRRRRPVVKTMRSKRSTSLTSSAPSSVTRDAAQVAGDARDRVACASSRAQTTSVDGPFLACLALPKSSLANSAVFAIGNSRGVEQRDRAELESVRASAATKASAPFLLIERLRRSCAAAGRRRRRHGATAASESSPGARARCLFASTACGRRPKPRRAFSSTPCRRARWQTRDGRRG